MFCIEKKPEQNLGGSNLSNRENKGSSAAGTAGAFGKMFGKALLTVLVIIAAALVR